MFVRSLARILPCLAFAAAAPAQDVLVPLTGVAALGGALGHSCALATDGALRCWGRNLEGQLGTGNYFSTATPFAVRGLPGPATAFSAGKTHSCAVVAGVVWCWGSNLFGELGSSVNSIGSPAPIVVPGVPAGATAVAAGDVFTCAIVAGSVWCWGANGFGSLGDGTDVDSATPVQVQGIAGATQLVAGAYHACALDGGAARCWGYNGQGQVGAGLTDEAVRSPEQVVGLASGVVSISAGTLHACAVVGAGAVKCWGDNDNGQLGTAAVGQANEPVDAIASSVPARNVSTGVSHSCAAGIDDVMRCWGGNVYNQLGVDDTPAGGVAVVPIGLAPDVGGALAAGYHSCALRNDGSVMCWGFNAYGQVGEGSSEYRTAPVPVPVESAAAVAAGASHTCAVADDGIACWGYNGEGALGMGQETLYFSTPYAIESLASDATAVAAGFDHSCAVVSGAAWCWGNNDKGQLGNGTNDGSAAPVAVSGLSSGVTQISAGGNQTCAVHNGAVVCWGYNGNGELANGMTTDSNVPVLSVGLSGTVQSLSVGYNHGCAVVDGAAKCWGVGQFGQLGDGSSDGIASTPVAVQGLSSGVTAITAGYAHTCAIVAGAARCWGYDGYGQLGNGILDDTKLTPDAVSLLDAGVVAIAAGDDSTCAIRDASVLCWGGDYDGDVGDGGLPRTRRLVPTHAIGLAGRAAGGLTMNGTHACATTVGGGIACWGDDFLGGLGIGRRVIIERPAAVVADDRLFASGFD